MTKIDLVEAVSEDAVPTKKEEVQPSPEEKDTPTETPTVEKPIDPEEPKEEPVKDIPEVPEVNDDTEDREAKGLQAQRDKLKIEVKDNIVNLRAQRREQRKQETPKPQPIKDESLDPEADEQLNSWAEKKGLVSKEEIVSELNRENLLKSMKTTDDEFYDDNPEYIYSSELRQKHDSIMDSLKEAPTAEEYKKQLELAHDIVKDKNPTLFPSSSGQTLDAKKQALELAGKGTGGQAGSPQTESALSNEQKAQFRRDGYTDEEIKRMDTIKQNK